MRLVQYSNLLDCLSENKTGTIFKFARYGDWSEILTFARYGGWGGIRTFARYGDWSEILTFARYGGWGGIRTHETVSRLPVFKTGAFNHSATHPI